MHRIGRGANRGAIDRAADLAAGRIYYQTGWQSGSHECEWAKPIQDRKLNRNDRRAHHLTLVAEIDRHGEAADARIGSEGDIAGDRLRGAAAEDNRLVDRRTAG